MEDTIEQCFHVLQIMRKIVEAQGADFVYQKGEAGVCSYVEDGKSDCLIGRVLFQLGWTIEELSTIEGQGPNSDRSTLWHERLGHSSRQLLEVAQIDQDRGETWGTALSRALTLLKDGFPIPGLYLRLE
jgi:hypothetical protein